MKFKRDKVERIAIKRLMKRKGITVAELSRRLNMHRTTLDRIVHEQVVTSEKVAMQIFQEISNS